MAHAYTPGLKASEKVRIKKRRILPLLGRVTVKSGEIVESDSIVAMTEMPGKVHSVNVINKLGISPARINEYMLKKKGDIVEKGKSLAETKPWLNMLKASCPSPITGTVESISTVTGQVLLREPPNPIQINAYIDGKVIEVLDQQGVVIETTGTFIQGIFGIGGEMVGKLHLTASTPESVLKAEDINDELHGKIIVAGAFIQYEALKKALDIGVKGIIVGGFDDRYLKELLGYDLGVAVTGTESLSMTVIITEGFGKINMAQKLFDLLKLRSGSKASINGATQIRAGVVRPEIIIPYKDEINSGFDKGFDIQEDVTGIKPGDTVRIIRLPDFGMIGMVNKLPPDPQIIETGSKVRVLEVKFPNGSSSIVARANVEKIEQ